MVNNILVVWEFGHHNSSLMKRSGALAKLTKSNVLVAAFMPDNIDEKKVQHELGSDISKFFDSSLTVDTRVLTDKHIVRDVLTLNAEQHSDLVIKCKSENGQLFKSSDDLSLIQELGCPILVASNHKRKAGHAILATIDVDESSDEQVKMNSEVCTWSSYFAELTQSAVDGMYNIPMSKAVLELDVFDPEEVLLKEGESARSRLNETANNHDITLNKFHIFAGDIGKNVKGVTGKMKPELLVVGSVGRKGIKGLIIGNTAETIIKNARCDVLIVKPKAN